MMHFTTDLAFPLVYGLFIFAGFSQKLTVGKATRPHPTADRPGARFGGSGREFLDGRHHSGLSAEHAQPGMDGASLHADQIRWDRLLYGGARLLMASPKGKEPHLIYSGLIRYG